MSYRTCDFVFFSHDPLDFLGAAGTYPVRPQSIPGVGTNPPVGESGGVRSLEGTADAPCQSASSTSASRNQHAALSLQGPSSSRNPQPSGFERHPNRAAWLASRGLTTLTITLEEQNPDDFWYIELEHPAANAAKRPCNTNLNIRRRNPFVPELLEKLLRVPPPELAGYLDKVCFVMNELSAAVRLKKRLFHEELQQILEATAALGHSLDHPWPQSGQAPWQPEIPGVSLQTVFNRSIVAALTEFLAAQPEMPVDPECGRSYGEAAIVMLSNHARCIKIIQLLPPLRARAFWPYMPLRSLLLELWTGPFETLSSQISDILPVYDFAYVATQLPPQTFTALLPTVPEEVRNYLILFLMPVLEQ